uniref:Uncharacterized protein n=1 Tax=Leersia perrieri TaxID=77586 RepID=A0A0D9V0P6_9ORYZ
MACVGSVLQAEALALMNKLGERSANCVTEVTDCWPLMVSVLWPLAQLVAGVKPWILVSGDLPGDSG